MYKYNGVLYPYSYLKNKEKTAQYIQIHNLNFIIKIIMH